MNSRVLTILLAWLALTSVYAFATFGWDKYKARRQDRSRISEFHLLSASALGGWLGGLLGMLVFRHKSAKTTFKIKFALAFLVWVGLLWIFWNRRGFLNSMVA